MSKKLVAALAVVMTLVCSPAFAQFTSGQVLTASQLNAALAAPTITGGSINGAPIGQTDPSSAAFTTLNVSGSTTFSMPLSTGNGGTGLSSMPSHGVVVGAGTASPNFVLPSIASYALLSNGSAADPSFQQLTAPIISYTPSGTGAVATTVKAFLDSFLQYPSGQFYQNAGAKVNRIRDRLFVGPAADNLGTNAASQPDWLTQYQLAKGRTYGFVQTSQMAVLNGNAGQDSLMGLTVGAQTTGRPGSGSQAIGLVAMGVNNANTAQSDNATWAGYFEAFRDTSVSGNGGAYGIEIDTMNFTNATPVTDPYSQANDQTIGIQMASGGGFPGTLYPTTVGINFQNNNTTFDKGIVFGSNSITGATGTSGSGVAIALGNGHMLQWYGGAGVPTSSILSNGTTQAGGIQQIFSENTLSFNNSSAKPVFKVFGVASGVNGIQALGAATGQNVQVQAIGDDTNIGLQLTPKGSGSVVVSGPMSGAAAAFTTLSASSTVSGAGFTSLLAPYAPLASPTFTGTVTIPTGASIATPNITGVTNGSTASAGSLGENLTGNNSATSMTSGTSANCTSKTLTAGDWLVWGTAQFSPAAGTTFTGMYAGLSTTSATLPAYAQMTSLIATFATGQAQIVPTPMIPLNVSSSTTVYLVGNTSFGTSTMTCSGTINAVRYH